MTSHATQQTLYVPEHTNNKSQVMALVTFIWNQQPCPTMPTVVVGCELLAWAIGSDG
jgi:hypothetical protein